MRKINLKSRYKHFEGKECMVLCTSTPVTLEEFLKSTTNLTGISTIYSESICEINVHQYINGTYHHLNTKSESTLVVYMDLHGNFQMHTMPYDKFMEEVDTSKHPNASQQYVFENID